MVEESYANVVGQQLAAQSLALMEESKRRVDLEKSLREAIESFIVMVNPMIPHFAEEAWSMLGHKTPLTQTPWPKVDPALLESDTVTLAVQVNGKMRATITLPANADQKAAEAAALSEANVQNALEGKAVKKVIVVPGRIVNVVAG